MADRLATEFGLHWEHSAKWGALWSKDERVLLAKVVTYMNRSGEPLAAIAQFYKIPNEQILVVPDDLALPLGLLRIRMAGSSGGHNGLESTSRRLRLDTMSRGSVGAGARPAVVRNG